MKLALRLSREAGVSYGDFRDMDLGEALEMLEVIKEMQHGSRN